MADATRRRRDDAADMEGVEVIDIVEPDTPRAAKRVRPALSPPGSNNDVPVGMSQAQDVVEWDDDHGYDLRNLFQSPPPIFVATSTPNWDKRRRSMNDGKNDESESTPQSVQMNTQPTNSPFIMQRITEKDRNTTTAESKTQVEEDGMFDFLDEDQRRSLSSTRATGILDIEDSQGSAETLRSSNISKKSRTSLFSCLGPSGRSLPKRSQTIPFTSGPQLGGRRRRRVARQSLEDNISNSRRKTTETLIGRQRRRLRPEATSASSQFPAVSDISITKNCSIDHSSPPEDEADKLFTSLQKDLCQPDSGELPVPHIASCDTQQPDQSKELISRCDSTTKPQMQAEPSDEDDDLMTDFNFSEEDLAAIDRRVYVALSQRENSNGCEADVATGAAREASTNVLDAEAPVESPPTADDDEYGDFPAIDFDSVDRMIEQRQATNVETPSLLLDQRPVNNCRHATVSKHSAPTYPGFTRYLITGIDAPPEKFIKTLLVKAWVEEVSEPISSSLGHASGSRFNRSDSPRSISSFPFASNDDDRHKISHDGCIHLMGEWFYTECRVGDIVHICSLSGAFRTDSDALPLVLHTAPPAGSDPDDDLLLILHPDLPMLPTVVSESVSCMRKAVLKGRMGSTPQTKKLVMGTLRHDLFQRCLVEQDFRMDAARRFALHAVRCQAENLVGCDIREEQKVVEELLEMVPQMQLFARQYLSFGNSDLPHDTPVTSSNASWRADSLHAAEEAIISPELGLKGSIDATLVCGGRNLTALELKTGYSQKGRDVHSAQLALYTMMLQMQHGTAGMNGWPAGDREQEIGAALEGILLYLNKDRQDVSTVSPTIGEVKSLIGQRNCAASALFKFTDGRHSPKQTLSESRPNKDGEQKARTVLQKIVGKESFESAPQAELPPLLNSSFACDRCFLNRECMMYAASNEVSSEQEQHKNPQGTLKAHFTNHLTEKQLSYFRHWDRLIDLEEMVSRNMLSTYLLESSSSREQRTGKTFSCLVVHKESRELRPTDEADPQGSSIVRLTRSGKSQNRSSLSSLNIESSSQVILSRDSTLIQKGKLRSRSPGCRQNLHVLRGFVLDVRESAVDIRVSMKDKKRLFALSDSVSKECGQEMEFRLDKDESAGFAPTLRQNLINLFTGDIADYSVSPSQRDFDTKSRKDHLSRLRRSIVDLDCPPRFHHESLDEMFNQSKRNGSTQPSQRREFDILKKQYEQLNSDQQAAVSKSVAAESFAILQGFPGSGKTFTTAFVARMLAAQGKRVLVTSYTHSAVDTLLMKIADSSCSPGSVVRIGKKATCHPKVHRFLVDQVALHLDRRRSHVAGSEVHNVPQRPSVECLYHAMSNARIVGVTTLTIPRTPLLQHQHFDVVIVDEAGQINQVATIGAVMAADSFILVGDHKQLPPLVSSEAAEDAGYGESLMKRLAEAYPDAVARLTLQYRMNEDICFLSNQVAYFGALRCANEGIARCQLDLPYFPSAIASPETQAWLHRSVDPANSVLFLDTDGIGGTFTADQRNETSDDNVAGPCLESRVGGGDFGAIVNEAEVEIVRQVTVGLAECGLDPTALGIICPYRSQLRLLRQDENLCRIAGKGLEISTIDSYQGRDKSVILISLVRSNTKGRCGRLLEDNRRLNVAFSRAKHKMIIVGSRSTLTTGSCVFGPLLRELGQRGWTEMITGL